jgi:hypothetical protein
MQPNEKTNDKASLQANQQPKKTWQEPELIVLDINTGQFAGFEQSDGKQSNSGLFG